MRLVEKSINNFLEKENTALPLNNSFFKPNYQLLNKPMNITKIVQIIKNLTDIKERTVDNRRYSITDGNCENGIMQSSLSRIKNEEVNKEINYLNSMAKRISNDLNSNNSGYK